MFRDRVEAGRRLSEHLTHLEGRDDVVVLGLPEVGCPWPSRWPPVSIFRSM
jgi:predicted phosphoribosyltransferase